MGKTVLINNRSLRGKEASTFRSPGLLVYPPTLVAGTLEQNGLLYLERGLEA